MRNSLLVILLLCCLASCHSTKLAVREQVELPGITEGRLLKNVETNALDFNTLYAKKINLNLRDGEKSNNLKAILRVQRDSFIWMSITAPMGIEVARVLDVSGFAEKEIDGSTINLSLGERQKLGLLRALSRPEPVVLLDEPLTNLDAATSARLCDYLAGLRGRRTVVAIMHSDDLDAAADQVLRIEGGRLERVR